MASERSKRDLRSIVAHEVTCQPGDDDLPAVGRRADPVRAVTVEAYVSLVADLRLSRVDADAHSNGLLRGPGLDGQRALEVDGRRRRVVRTLECQEDTVSGPVHLVAAMLGRGAPDERARARADVPVALAAERVDEPGRALDVGEEERDGPGRELPPSSRRRRFRSPRSVGDGDVEPR